MDKLKAKRNLYAGLGDFARQTRAKQMRKKYGSGSPEMDADFEKQDEAIDKAAMPVMPKKGGVSVTISEGIADTAKDADKSNRDYEQTLADMDEDEEMQKWMAKQQG